MNYGLLVSGELGKICLQKLSEEKNIDFVLTDSNSIGIRQFCKVNHIPVFEGNPRNGKSADFLTRFKTDVLFSINYLFIVENDILKFPLKYAINFHGSLLPKYRGRTPHVWAIINNETETGVTAHLMSENCDEGAIICQEKIPITEDSTGSDILNSFFSIYPIMIKKVVNLIEDGKMEFREQDNSIATYFGKRSPEDGKIDWNWQKLRIRNWVRAQAYPYPGSFSFYGGEKIVFNKVEYSNDGFHWKSKNGYILKGGEFPVVKTPNGALKILEMIVPEGVVIEEGKIFE